MMRVALAPAFILHRRPYRETSMLLDVFSEEHGRVSLIAKGVRTTKSTSRASLMQPFVPLLISWQGRTELMTLTLVETNGSSISLRGDCLLAAFYLNELLNYLLPKQDPHPNLYSAYYATLSALQTHPLQEKALRIFEKKILEELGYGLQLSRTVNNSHFSKDEYYKFYPEHGFELCKNDINQSDTTIFAGQSLLAIAQEQLSEENIIKDAKRLMRLALKPLLVGKELNSRSLFMETRHESTT
jgi:DNA repair protein RecO (recombination protein O)